MAADDFVVLDHKLDEAAGVYRVVVGIPVLGMLPVFDDAGEPVLDDAHVLDEAGEPIMDEVPLDPDDPESEKVRVPRMGKAQRWAEDVVDYAQVHDYVFAADDNQWHAGKGKARKRRSHDDVATAQRERVRDAIKARERAAADAEASRHAGDELPGVGDTL